MTLYDVGLLSIIWVGLAASGFFLWKFRPSRRFALASMDTWILTAAVFGLYAWSLVRYLAGLTDQPASIGSAVFGLTLGGLIDFGLVIRVIHYLRAADAGPQSRRATDGKPVPVLPPVSEPAAAARPEVTAEMVKALLALGERLELNQRTMSVAVRHLVDTGTTLHEAIDAIRSEGIRVAADLAVAQAAVDDVAADLTASRSRADAVPAGDETPVGTAADAGARSGDNPTDYQNGEQS